MAVLMRAAALAFAVAMMSPASEASAQTYPSKPVRIIVPFGAGGPADVYARILAQHLSEALKQSFVVENRPGAGAIIGTDAVAKSAPDGYTLLVMSNTHTTNESLIPNKPFQLMRDFVPVAPINYSDLLMVAHPSTGVKNLKEFIALAKSKPGALNYASSGPGTPYHMAGELFKAMSGTDIVHVPHKASGDMRNSVLGGHVQMMFDAITVMAEGVRSGQLIALGTTGRKALDRDAGYADRRRGGRPRLRGHHLDRPDGAEGDAEGDRRQAQRRDQQGDRARRHQENVGRAGRGADVHDARRVRQISAHRHREMGARRQGLRRQGGVRPRIIR